LLLLPAPVQALAEPRLARWLAGAKVTVADISEASAAQTVDLIRRAGGVAQACCGDVTKADYAEWLVAATLRPSGGWIWRIMHGH
jgi:hypothetical protein